jgi:hypothetical protein
MFYENVFQNPELFLTQVSLYPEHSTLRAVGKNGFKVMKMFTRAKRCAIYNLRKKYSKRLLDSLFSQTKAIWGVIWKTLCLLKMIAREKDWIWLEIWGFWISRLQFLAI